ncbi:hypothetical protein F5J12DRAFT_853575 [Pisolithus orientalis]|uniref:uncharacterized protein n=1 Tax=Pisolithus orientalis TaxID=936130 RepID=UPI0022248000|nr:uncharacterized protein F5J12DRAFT_853575 [Pisolithus orientalis]KAI5996447.1 hypothetical protein F5J12DRAFT_853575 [Pisolithus orientalis]
MSNAGSEAQDQPDLALDPSDPLNLLLNNSGTDSDSDLSQTAGPPDWSQLSSLWLQAHQPTPGVNSKPQDVSTMFDFPFPMDMELTYPPSIAMGVDPSMLYLDNNKGLHFSIPEMTSAVPIRPRDLLAESSLSSADDSSSSTSSPGSPSVGFGASPVVSHAPTHNPDIPYYHSNAVIAPILNARIQSLKAAVPALRVLDPNYRNDEHRVDERGYIDGVKVARKGSKANVLGKAVEYIQVLKRREARLNREKEGLRTLVCRFPNGETVLTQWEMEWVKKYGGPERDEIDNAGVEEASDEEDGDDDDDGSERARKKPKVECPPQKKEKRKIAPAVPATMQDTAAAAALVAPPPVSASATSILLTGPNVASHGQAVSQTASQFAQPQQYLLAVFALISFFNSPLTTSMSAKQYRPTHEGVVFDSVEAIHLLASALVIFSIVLTWIPLPTRWSQSRILRFVPFRFVISQPNVSDSDSEAGSSSNEGTCTRWNPLFLTLNSKGSKDEYQKLIDVLEVNLGVAGLFRGAIGLWSPRDSEHRLKRQAWMRLAELIVLKSGDARVSVALRLQVYNNLSSGLHTSATEQSPPNLVSDLCTLALLVYSLPLPFAQSRAERLWNRAWRIVDTNAHHVFTFERLIFKEMTLEGALECLSVSSEGTDVNGPTPITTLGSTLLHRRLLAHASSLFVHRVAEAHEGVVEDFSSEDEEKRWRETVEYGCSIDGGIAALCSVFKRTLDVDALEWGSVDSSLQALLTAIILHQQVFPRRQSDSTLGSLADFNTSFLSPPPSPQSGQPKDARSRRLRCILGSSVFEQSATSSDTQSDACSLSLEDARDRVVDELVNLERETRRLR